MAIKVIGQELTSNGSGDASVTITTSGGLLRQLVLVPDSVATPTTSWDVLISDIAGVTLYSDTAIGTSAEVHVPLRAGTLTGGTASSLIEGLVCVGTSLTITGANMGAAKKARVYLYLED